MKEFYGTVLGAIGGLLQQRNEELKIKRKHNPSYTEFESLYNEVNAKYIGKIENMLAEATYIVAMSEGDWVVEE